MASDSSPLDDPRIASFGMMLEATRRLERLFERTLRDQHDLSEVTFEALLRIARSPDRQMSMTQLADQMVLTSGGVTRLVDRLAAAGLAERLRCDQDRRVQWAKLTDRGLSVVTSAAESHVQDLEAHFSSLMTSAEMRTVTKVCDRLRGECSS